MLKHLVEGGAFSRANAISAFEACGIHPLNRQKITAEKLSTSVPLVNPDGPATSSASVQNTPASDSSVTVSVGTSSSQVLSPRKGIETAILSHLRQITPTGVSEKRVHVRRTLAECLTSDEVSKRLKEDERRKKANQWLHERKLIFLQSHRRRQLVTDCNCHLRGVAGQFLTSRIRHSLQFVNHGHRGHYCLYPQFSCYLMLLTLSERREFKIYITQTVKKRMFL